MDFWIIIVFIILIILSAFFSSSEIGIMSVPRHLIEALVKQWNKRAQQLMWLKDRTDKLLITILIGNNLINTLIAALATKISLDIGRTIGFQEGLAVWIATAIITVLLLLFGEILPKTMATRMALPFGLFIAPIYIFLIRLFRPFVWAIEKFLILFNDNNNHIRKVNQEEIEALVDIATEQWSIEEDMSRHIKKIMDFHETTAQEIITPRIRMESLSATLTVDQALDYLKQFSHTRIPIYEKNIDDIQRIVSEKELLLYHTQQLWSTTLQDLTLPKVLKIPLTMPLDKIIELFKQQRRQIAIVMDEYGWVAWLITLEDIIEEIFGEFVDETDKEAIPIRNDGDTYIVQWSVVIDDLIERMNLTWHDIGLDEQSYSWETISYVITSELERFPEKNEEILFKAQDDEKSLSEQGQHHGLSIKITKRDDNTINEIQAMVKKV